MSRGDVNSTGDVAAVKRQKLSNGNHNERRERRTSRIFAPFRVSLPRYTCGIVVTDLKLDRQ